MLGTFLDFKIHTPRDGEPVCFESEISGMKQVF